MIVYSKPGCAPCKQLKKYLEIKKINFQEKDITDNKYLEELVGYGVSTVPTVVINDRVYVGHSQQTLAAINSLS